VRNCQKKLGAIRDSRAQQANAQAQQNSGPNPFHQMQHMQHLGQNLPFPPQLQHQMQASPIPPSQGQQMSVSMNPAMTTPTVGGGGAGTPGRGLQLPNNFTPNQQPRPNPQPGQMKMTPEDNEAINRLAQQLAATTTLEDRRKIQQNLQKIPADQLQNMKARGVNPMAAYFRERATKQWRHQQQVSGGNSNFPPNMQMYPTTPASRQGQAPANMAGAQASRAMPGTGQPGATSFTNNIDHFQGLQADGLRSQEQGQLVVPASNGQGINPEQFRMQQFANNQQLAKQNSGGRINQQFIPHQTQPGHLQQGQGVQQVQQDKTNNAPHLQAQSQARARAEAAARAQQQQVGMQNQPGLQGMSQSGTPLTMLTRPVGANVPAPAQPQPQGTPQPRPPSRALNAGSQALPQMQQNVPQDGPQNNNQQAALPSQMPPGLPQSLQLVLSRYPQTQWNGLIERFKQQAVRQGRFPTGAPPMSQTLSQPGQNPHTSNGQLAGDHPITAIPMQHSASAGATVTQGPIQGMGPTPQMMFHQQQQQQRRQPDGNHPAAPQMPGQQAPPSLLTQQDNSLPHLEHSIAYMDQQPLPQQVYQNVVQRRNMPGQIKTWVHLKQYLTQNPDPHLSMNKIILIQKLQFQQMLQWMRDRNRPTGDQSRPISVQPGPGPQPPTSMPPNMQDHTPQGVLQQNQVPANVMANLPPVTKEEIQRFRMNNPQLAQIPEAQIKAHLTTYRQNEARRRMGLGQPPQNGQQYTFVPGQTSAQPPQLGPARQQQNQAVAAPGPNVGQMSQMHPGMTGTRPQQTPAPRPASQATAPPQMPTMNQHQGKGMRRTNDDGVTEVRNPNTTIHPGSRPPHVTVGPPPAPLRGMSKEELSRLSPEQQKSYRSKQAQHQQQQMFLAHIARLTEEVRRTTPGLQPLSMDAPSRARIVKVLTAPLTKQMLTRFNGFLFHYFLMTKSLDAVKQLLSYKMHLFPQYTPASVRTTTWEPAEQFSVGADYAETAVKDLLARFSQVMSRVGPQQPAANAAPPPDANGSHPLSADNLKKHQDIQAAQRAKRPAQEVPPAPTASQPPFPFNDASPRGQGTPRYAPSGLKQGLKQEDLKLPSKRQKKNHQDNTASTPVAGQVTPVMSPQATKIKKTQDMPFKCTVPRCEFHDKGFATKSELGNHSSTAHKPVEEHIADPLAFFFDSMRHGMGLDENGEAKVKLNPHTTKAPEMQRTASKIGGVGSKPPTPAPAAVAMARNISQASGSKDASPKPPQSAGANSRPGSGNNGASAAAHAAWEASNVSMSDLQNTFGDLVSGAPRTSLTHHDPLAQSSDIGDFMDQFMESEAWTKIQETAVNVDVASTKATESPAQNSDRGQGSSDISKGDDLFIKIGAEDTELAESWALPELQIEPESGAEDTDEVDQWMKMDFGDVSTGDMDITHEMDFAWKEIDWDKVLAKQDKAAAVAAKK
jgi:hypothetical protein